MNVLASMTTEEAADALARARLAVLPVGSVEQHGPHLALDTDAAVAELLAGRVAAELGDDAILCPLLPYGLSEHHLGFAGTLTLRPHTLLAVLSDLFESLHLNGVDRVMVVNGHGGNIDALRLAARQARRDRGTMVASVMWSVVAADLAANEAAGTSYGHACEVETSVMWALDPERVRRDRLTDGARLSHDELTDPPAGTVDEPVWLDEWSRDGALGRPQLASREAGERVVAGFVERAVAYARRMIDRNPPGAAL